MSRSLLVITRHAPWSGLAAREALDLVLAGGAFDLPVGLLFLDDGVFQLLAGQQAPTLQQKDLCANLQALPLFGVEALFACARRLHGCVECAAVRLECNALNHSRDLGTFL